MKPVIMMHFKMVAMVVMLIILTLVVMLIILTMSLTSSCWSSNSSDGDNSDDLVLSKFDETSRSSSLSRSSSDLRCLGELYDEIGHELQPGCGVCLSPPAVIPQPTERNSTAREHIHNTHSPFTARCIWSVYTHIHIHVHCAMCMYVYATHIMCVCACAYALRTCTSCDPQPLPHAWVAWVAAVALNQDHTLLPSFLTPPKMKRWTVVGVCLQRFGGGIQSLYLCLSVLPPLVSLSPLSVYLWSLVEHNHISRCPCFNWCIILTIPPPPSLPPSPPLLAPSLHPIQLLPSPLPPPSLLLRRQWTIRHCFDTSNAHSYFYMIIDRHTSLSCNLCTYHHRPHYKINQL